MEPATCHVTRSWFSYRAAKIDYLDIDSSAPRPQRPRGQQTIDEIKTLKTALDYHTVENRNKRKSLRERRNTIAKHRVGIAAVSLQCIAQRIEVGDIEQRDIVVATLADQLDHLTR
jgi:hypothetical protein